MKIRHVIYQPAFLDDLELIADWVAEAAGDRIAEAYIDRLDRHCLRFDLGGERGTRRDDLRPGLRVTGFEGRVTLLFTVTETDVIFLRAFYGGQDWEADQNDAITD